jgi:hypothetical protein
MAPGFGWCVWCGVPANAGLVLARVVAYHLLCWEWRACLVERTKWD